MSTPTARRSIDSFESNLSPLSQQPGHPFSQYDSSQRPGSDRRFSTRRGSIASVSSFNSTINSIGGSLDVHTRRTNSSVTEVSQNAISNLLQPSMVRTGLLPTPAASSSTYRAPTTRDIPPVTLTNIPHVEPSSFRDYLKRIGPLFETFQRGRAEQEAQGFQRDADAKKNEEIGEVVNKASKDAAVRPSPARQASTQSLSPAESPRARRRSSGYSRRRANEPTPLSTIPNVYLDQNFHLENPRIFDIVSERAEIVRPPPGTANEEKHANGSALPPRKALATNAILQEKLSWYMDTVEVHLINSISAASTSFFAALGSLRDLQHEAAESVAKIQSLRADLAALDDSMAKGGLEIARMRQKRENVRKLGQATAQVQLVVDRIVHCEDLVDNGQYEIAVDRIASVDRLIAGQPEPISKFDNGQEPDGDLPDQELIDLREVKALQGLSGNMQQLHSRIGKGFETRFLEAMLSDLRQHVERVPPQETMRRWASASQRSRGDHKRVPTGIPTYLETSPQMRQDLLAALQGLNRAGHTAQATVAFRESMMKEMKALIRKHLPSSNDDDAESMTSVSTRAGRQLNQQEKSAILARNLRALDEQDSEDLLVNVYTNVSEALRRLSIQVKVLLDVTSSFDRRSSRASSPEPGMSPRSPQMQFIDGNLRPTSRPSSPARLQEELSQALDMSSLLGQAVDVAQTQITRVLKVRAEQSHRLPLERFLRYFTINRFFADECEAISGRSGQVLKTIVNTQLNAFVSTMGETETQRIAQQLDSDQWEAKDFKENDQEVLARILGGMNSDPEIWTKGTRVWETPSTESTNGISTINGTKEEEPAPSIKTAIKPAYIDETRYILVQSAITLLPTLDRFLALIASIPSIAPSAIPALAEVLRTFNSRSSQLILGAGATRIAGLKNITTKHLALSSQALSFVIALVPYMRESVRRHVGGRSEALAEFDKVKRLYQDHQMGIHDKLVEIMTSRANAHVNAMRKVEFDKFEAGAERKASAYMETLTKETGTLHRVLGRHLAEPDVLGIMGLIGKAYGEIWGRAFEEVEVRTQGGKERLLLDAELFEARLGKIHGFGDIGQQILAKVKAKSISDGGPKMDSKAATALAATSTKGDEKKEEAKRG